MKIEELTIPQLNEWAAKALGWKIRLWGAIPVWFDPNNEGRYRSHVSQWNPSQNWAQGGPLIEMKKLHPRFVYSGYFLGEPFENKWLCVAPGEPCSEMGDTLLVAGMRCIVALKFGKKVPDTVVVTHGND